MRSTLPIPESPLRLMPALSEEGPVMAGACVRSRLKLMLREGVGRLLNRLGVAGAIQPFRIVDRLDGRTVEVTVSPLFTRLRIDGRDYYFRRVSGSFDGTGSSP